MLAFVEADSAVAVGAGPEGPGEDRTLPAGARVLRTMSKTGDMLTAVLMPAPRSTLLIPSEI